MIHPKAHVARWVKLHPSVEVHAFAFVGALPSQLPSLARKAPVVEHLVIGEGTEVRPHATIYGGSRIGKMCLIGDSANIREGAVIGDRCIVGYNACISYDAELADEVRVENGTLIADGWKVGRGTFVGINVSTMSDRHPERYKFTGSNGSVIGERCLIGSGAVLLPGIKIGNDVLIGAGALVIRDVPDGARVLGNPSPIIAGQMVEYDGIASAHGEDHWR